MLILSRTLGSGTAAGLMTLLGTQTGNVVHALLAGIGVTTVILLFPVADGALKLVGVAYLVILAVQAWRAPATLQPEPGHTRTGAGPGRFFVQGLTNTLANPKMIAFFLALFPEFVRPANASLGLQSLILGATLALMAVAWVGLGVVTGGRFRAAVVSNTTFLKAANRLASLTFFGLGCRLAVEGRR